MKRLVMISILALVMIFSISYNVVAYKDVKSNKDALAGKTDRTLLREIHSQQKETIQMLKQIKALIESQE